MTTGIFIAGAVIFLGFIDLLGLIIITALSLWRDRGKSGETLWVNASESDPARAYVLAAAVRRMERGGAG